MNLDKRLKAVADLVLPATVLADVGCDHGYLSVYLIQNKRCEKLIAMDINKAPLQKARENILRYGCGDYIETRLSDGLRELKLMEAQGCVCAGMGGPLALQILWNDRDKVKEMGQIILQPQSELWLVRRTLKKWGFLIEKEDIALEDGKYYFMMRIRPGKDLCMDALPNEHTEFLGEELVGVETKEESAKTSSEIVKERLKIAAYELFAKELLDEKNELLREYIIKEQRRLEVIYQALCQREESTKCRKRRTKIEAELRVYEWALEQYEK